MTCLNFSTQTILVLLVVVLADGQGFGAEDALEPRTWEIIRKFFPPRPPKPQDQRPSTKYPKPCWDKNNPKCKPWILRPEDEIFSNRPIPYAASNQMQPRSLFFDDVYGTFLSSRVGLAARSGLPISGGLFPRAWSDDFEPVPCPDPRTKMACFKEKQDKPTSLKFGEKSVMPQ